MSLFLGEEYDAKYQTIRDHLFSSRILQLSLCELQIDKSIPKLERVSCKPVDPGLLVDGVDGMDLTAIADFYNITLHVPFRLINYSKPVVSIGRWN